MSAQRVLPAYSMNRESFPQMYERSLVAPLFKPWAEILIERAGVVPATSVLDVACGTGIVARLARRGGAHRVVGVDVSAPMLEVARGIEPSVDWREGNAAALPTGPGERFERVFCQQGLQFFTDRAQAARELRRVLAPDGVLLAAVWRGSEEMPLFLELQRVAERHLGAIHDQRHGFGDEVELESLLYAAGFASVRVEPMTLPLRFSDGAAFVRMNAMALVGMSGAVLAEADRERVLEAIVKQSIEAAAPFADGDGLAFDTRANVAVAR